jgi:ketosteroid isomerase-like protein
MSAEAEEQLRDLVAERVTAVRAKDVVPLAARQAADVVTFDVLPPLRSHGSGAVNEKTLNWFDGYASDIGYEVHELQVRASGDVGFCWFVYHVSGTLQTGEETTCGCGRHCVASGSTVSGESSMTTSRCRLIRRLVRLSSACRPEHDSGVHAARSRRVCDRCHPDPAVRGRPVVLYPG